LKIGNTGGRQKIYVRLNDLPECFARIFPAKKPILDLSMILFGVGDLSILSHIPHTTLSNLAREKKIHKWMQIVKEHRPMRSMEPSLDTCILVLSACILRCAFSEKSFKQYIQPTSSSS
jgi:hypothetical protein